MFGMSLLSVGRCLGNHELRAQKKSDVGILTRKGKELGVEGGGEQGKEGGGRRALAQSQIMLIATTMTINNEGGNAIYDDDGVDNDASPQTTLFLWIHGSNS